MTTHPTEDLAAFAIGALDRPDAARVEAHLAACAQCRGEVASFEDVAWAIAELAPAGADAGDLRGRVVARVARAPREAPPSRRSPGSGLRRLLAIRVPIAVPAALTVALAAAVVGAQAARSEGDSYARAVAAVAAGRVVNLAATPGSDARGTLVVPETGEPFLILRLPPPPAGKTFEAWVIRGGRALPAGISGERSGVVTLTLSERVAPGDDVAITLEDEGGVPQPRGAVILQGRT